MVMSIRKVKKRWILLLILVLLFAPLTVYQWNPPLHSSETQVQNFLYSFDAYTDGTVSETRQMSPHMTLDSKTSAQLNEFFEQESIEWVPLGGGWKMVYEDIYYIRLNSWQTLIIPHNTEKCYITLQTAGFLKNYGTIYDKSSCQRLKEILSPVFAGCFYEMIDQFPDYIF